MNSHHNLKHLHKNCILCGTENAHSLGLHFKIEKDGWLYSNFTATNQLQGYAGILHGGVICALLDAVMVNYLLYLNINAVTADMNIRFIHTIKSDATLKLRSKVISQRKSLFIVHGEILHDNKIMAKSIGKFISLPI